MKLKTAIILYLSFLCTSAFGQDTLSVTESEKVFSIGKQPSFNIVIPQAKLKDVINDWKKYVRQKNKSSFEETDGEYVITKVNIPEIGNDSFLVITTATDATGSINLTSAFASVDSVFYSSAKNPELSNKISTYIRNFAVDQYRNAVTDELAAENKKLELLNDELKTLGNDNEKAEKNISANERENDRYKEDIKLNLQEQEISTNAILQQQRVLATYLTESELKTAEEKKLKDLEKKKKNLQKDNESLHKKTEGNESENKSIQKKIDQNNSEIIPSKKNEIEFQKKKIEMVDAKLKNIK